jgi:hypothetical protein
MMAIFEVHVVVGMIHQRTEACDDVFERRREIGYRTVEKKVEDHGLAGGCTGLGEIRTKAADAAVRMSQAQVHRSGRVR